MKNFTNIIRQDILKMIHNAKSGHPGGALSCTDILAVLYKKVLNVPNNWDKDPDFKSRDRFILSKGHASAALYAVLANCGFFDKSLLNTFRIIGSKLQGHPSTRTGLAGIEVSTGSLGQGLSIAAGIALALRLDKINSKVFCLLGDGEMQEGSVWESLMNISNQKLNNLVVIVDKNNLQIDGATCDVKSIDPLDKKLEAFRFKVVEVNGHDLDELEKVLLEAKNSNELTAIIAHTIKGKGVSFMEDKANWHGKAPNDDELNKALEELKC